MFDVLAKYLTMFLSGAGLTLVLSLCTVVVGTLLGSGIALLRLSKRPWLRIPAMVYIEILRGTPLFLQIMIWNYGVSFPELPFLGPGSAALLAGIVALFINSSAYVAEVIRAGIQSVDKGQQEAAFSLGLSPGKTMRRVILPQAIRNILPALGNEFVIVIKDSSLVSAIGVMELMFQSRAIVGITYDPWGAYLTAAVFYLVMTFSMSRFIAWLERRMRNGKRKKTTGGPVLPVATPVLDSENKPYHMDAIDDSERGTKGNE